MALFEAQPPRPGQRPGRSFPVSSHSVSQAEESDGPDKKRRRVQRACDMCRLKKGARTVLCLQAIYIPYPLIR